MKQETNHVRGLPAIQESRERRKRFLAIPPRYLLWGLLLMVAWSVFYWKRTQNQIESWKAKLFARQRGVAAELGPKVEPLRDRIEQWILEAAKPYGEDVVTPEAREWDFGAAAGIYLRLRLADATDVKRVRRAADDSLRDGFTSCLFHEPNPNPTSGPACHATRDCPAGTFCNEMDHCVVAAQPYNMRAVYRGIRVLGEEWTVSLRTASDDMQMRLLDREFEAAILDDVPLAVDLMARAQFFMLVLDEAPPTAKPDIALEDLQAVPHPARVSLWGLKPGRDHLLLRLRRDIDARAVPLGERATADTGLAAAQQRQVNSCQLALHVRSAISP